MTETFSPPQIQAEKLTDGRMVLRSVEPQADHPRAELVGTMARVAAEGSGSSQHVDRLLVLGEPPQLDAGEITDKGYVNQAAVRDRRSHQLAMLMAETPPDQVVVRAT